VKQLSGQCAYPLTEQGTDKYADLQMAQAAALPFVAQALVEAILNGIENGYLVVEREGNQNVVRIPEP
jgi:hypothetical protein